MSAETFIDIVPVEALHERLGLSVRLDYPSESLFKPFDDWKMEIDDGPILRYLYRHLRPRRHLEFGTWEGAGACLCLEECDAHVWTINLPEGEIVDGRPVYSSTPAVVPTGAKALKDGDEKEVYQTDAGVFIGHLYRGAGFGHRVCQVLCDSRDWDASAYPAGFFDTALVDGGHTPHVVASDTRKALSLVRPGGLILWHDFCPDPALLSTFPSVAGVVASIVENWGDLRASVQDVFWIRPSFLLAAVRKGASPSPRERDQRRARPADRSRSAPRA